MRHLIITRGVPGCGKSTFIKNNNLSAYTLCPDDIRLMFSSPILTESGKLGIDQSNDKKVWELLYSLLEQRMARGELCVIDATHKLQRDINKYEELAKKYLYNLLIVDFSHVSLETCLAQNMQRVEYKQVPTAVIENQHRKVQSAQLSKKLTIIESTDTDAFDKWLKQSVQEKDLSQYKKLHVIGDIQGCATVLKEYFAEGLKQDEFYIFVGDFLDRGIENGEVMTWAIENLTHARNVEILFGNHETHLLRWIGGLPCKSQEFEQNTLPQILEAGITKGQVYSLLRKMRDILFISYKGKKLVVTHAGLSYIPKDPHLVPSYQYWKGIASYGEPVDELFTKSSPDYIQFHGHRNTHSLSIMASANSLNLEGKVEFGESLRIATIEDNS